MRVFVSLGSGIVEDGAVPVFSFEFTVFLGPELIFQWESLFFWSQAYWKLIFRWESLFFWPKAYSKFIFQWESLFFWFQALWKTVLCPFWYEFTMFLDPALFFQWESLFFGPRPIENWFLMTVFVLWSQALWKTVLCHFLNEFFVFRTRFVFLWESLFVWFQHYWKTIFNESDFFVAKRIESGFFNDSVCFLVSGLLKTDFLMKVFAFLVSGIVEDGAVHFFHFNL